MTGTLASILGIISTIAAYFLGDEARRKRQRKRIQEQSENIKIFAARAADGDAEARKSLDAKLEELLK